MCHRAGEVQKPMIGTMHLSQRPAAAAAAVTVTQAMLTG